MDDRYDRGVETRNTVMCLAGPDPLPKRAFDHGLRRQAVLASLLADVFQGRLRPGEHLVTQNLAERFGVSHTPIREALIAMAGLGVIDLQPNRGAVVRRVTAKDVNEVCQVRRVLECEAVRRACGRVGRDELAELTEGFLRQTEAGTGQPGSDSSTFIAQARALDSRLHDQIAASCGNAFLAHELTRLKTLFRAFRDVAWAHVEARNDLRRLGRESLEHLAIVEALATGDPRAASRAMSRHIMAGATYWSRVIREREMDDREPSVDRSPAVTASPPVRATKSSSRNGHSPTQTRRAERGESNR